ncbi:MAG: cytochrome P450 [Pseudomonadales bacterium]|nr:cytochrome P450 [Pseudomonadales bacterium]
MTDKAINLTDPDFLAAPYPYYDRMRAQASAVQVGPGGVWAVTRFKDVLDVLKRPEDFSSEPAEDDRERIFEKAFNGANIIGSDNPRHDRLRSIMQKRFTPNRMKNIDARVTELSTALLNAVAQDETFDLVSSFSVPLPVTVIAELLGVENNRIDDFKRWSNGLVTLVNAPEDDAVREQAMKEVFELAQYLSAAADNRREQPSDDLIGHLIDAEKEPERISSGEVLSYCILLLAAGNETTTNLIGGMIHALFEHPEQLAMLQKDPSLLNNAIEEGLRYCSPVQGLFRTTKKEVVLGDTTIPAKSRVWVSYAAANRDPDQFKNPNEFDINRDYRGHVGFGWGLHFCLGSNLAKLEGRIAMEKMLPLLSNLELTSPVEYLPTWIVRGPKALNVKRI